VIVGSFHKRGGNIIPTRRNYNTPNQKCTKNISIGNNAHIDVSLIKTRLLNWTSNRCKLIAKYGLHISGNTITLLQNVGAIH